MPKKAMRTKLTVREPLDGEAKVVFWTVWSDSRSPAGWMFRSHDGCERFSAGNWGELVARVRETADNYGCDARIS
jgi:hypothetical protein